MFFKGIALLIEIFNWIRIVLSPVVIGFFIGTLIYNCYRNAIGLSIGIGLILAGFVIGIIWATSVWKKHGTTFFMYRLDASPDIDEAIKPKDKKY